MDTVRKVNLRGESGQTTQGFYVVDANGGAYGFNNNRSVDRVLDFLTKNLDAYHKAPHERVSIAAEDNGIPKPPDGATVLRVFQRILPVPKNSHPTNENVQRDHFWLLKDEIAELGKSKFPESLSLRLCRFVFNDAVRGEPDMWSVSEVRERQFRVGRQGDIVTITGNFKMRKDDNSRGLEGEMVAELSLSGSSLTGFKGIADTTAWGQSTYTPDPPAGRFPVKFAFVLPSRSEVVVAPQATFFGNEYLTGR